jgi:hypothetical protein
MRSGNAVPVSRSQAWLRIVACLAFLAGCTGGSSMGPSPVSKAIRPVWTAGQTWKVEYLRTVVSPVMGPVTEPPPPRRSVWIYEVEKPPTDRQAPTAILVREEGGERRYELRFDPGDLSLVSVFEIAGSRRETAGDATPHQPYFGWSQTQPCIFDWPLFSTGGTLAKLPFRAESGAPAEQSAEITKEGLVDLQLTSAAASPEGPETTRSRQSWAPGQPWWTSASVEIEYVSEGKRETTVEIRGRRLP